MPHSGSNYARLENNVLLHGRPNFGTGDLLFFLHKLLIQLRFGGICAIGARCFTCVCGVRAPRVTLTTTPSPLARSVPRPRIGTLSSYSAVQAPSGLAQLQQPPTKLRSGQPAWPWGPLHFAAATGPAAAAPATPAAASASHKAGVAGEGLLAPALLPALGFPLPSSASRPEEMGTAAGAGGWARAARAAGIEDFGAK